MGLLEDLSSGKYNLVLIGILFVFMFHQYWGASCASQTKFDTRSTKEPMADVSNDIKEAVKQVYLADVEAIRNLSEVATKLQAGGYTVAGDLTVKGTIKSQSLDSLNNKIDSINSSLTSNISTNNTNLTNSINSLQSQINSINSNFNNYVKYSDNIRITNKGTGQQENGEPFIGVCGYGPPTQCGSKIDVVMVSHPSVSTFKIVRP